MKKISTLAIALIAMGSLATPVSAQNIMPKVSAEGGATYTYYLKGASNGVKDFYFKNAANSSDQVVATNQTDSRLKIKLVASGDKYNIIATNLSGEKTYLGCTGTTNSGSAGSGDDTHAASNIVTLYTAADKTNADWTIAKGEAKTNDKGKMNQYYPYYKLCPGGSSSVNIFGGAKADKVIGLYDADEQGSNWNFIPADVATLIAWAEDAKAEIQAITTTADKNDVLNAIQAAQNATEADVDSKATNLLSAYTSFFKQVKLATITDFEKDYNAHKGQAGYATEASFAAYEAKVQSVTTESTYDQIASAASAAASAITGVNMPADGKVYVFTNVQKNGARYYLKYVNDNLKALERGEESAENLDDAAKFVCRVVGDKYVFVNVKDGKYLIYKTEKSQYGNGTNSGKGYIDTYAAGYADLSVSKHNTYPCLNIIGKRSDSFPTSYFILNKDGSYNAYNKEGYTDDYSTAFKFEEVSYPNTIAFNKVSDVEGVKSIATFSAPFATVIPEGVTAYYVSTADNSKATMKAITGEAIPANEGVLLTSESAEAVTMVPATDETLATIENNKLGNSAGAAKTIAEGDNAYILANGANGTAFYKGKIGSTLKANKAYLTLDVVGGEAISMNFGGNVTGINQIVNAEQNNAPVYDLTGRRVVRTVKGGLYIKGGNKFIAR
jgi:hypothetical protein